MRHMAEISKVVGNQGNLILAVYSDVGGDHRVTFLSVQLGLIALFIRHKLLYLVAGRCAPCQSYMDPEERVMYLLNLGIQCVGVVRQEMEAGYEKQIKSLNSMNDLRNASNKNDALRDKINESIKPVTDLLGSTFNRLKWKEKTLTVNEAVIDSLTDILKQVDPAFNKESMQQKHLRNYPVLQKFMDTHTSCGHYVFSIKRCLLEDCEVCSASAHEQLPIDLLESFDFLFLMTVIILIIIKVIFDEVWGTVPNERYRPSLGAIDTENTVVIPFQLSGEIVRGVVTCELCKKPRCYYSRKKLTEDELMLIRLRIEDVEYTCGGQLFSEDDDAQFVYVEVKITCESPISAHYYHKRKGFQVICHICGDSNPEAIAQDIINTHASVHPVCALCATKGYKPRLRRKNFLGKRKK